MLKKEGCFAIGKVEAETSETTANARLTCKKDIVYAMITHCDKQATQRSTKGNNRPGGSPTLHMNKLEAQKLRGGPSASVIGRKHLAEELQ